MNKSSQLSSRKPDVIEVTEMCCGAACDREKRDTQLKLLGVQEYLRLLKRTTPLTDGQVYVLDTVATEYKVFMMSYTGNK